MLWNSTTRVRGICAGLFLLLAGCGEVKVAPGDFCAGDEDCAANQWCSETRCTDVCRTDEQCRAKGLGFSCDDGVCSGTDDGRFLLVVQVPGGAPVEAPEGPVSGEVPELTDPVTVDASATLYQGTGTAAWQWTVADAGGLAIAIADPTTARMQFAAPRVFADTVVTLACAVDDGTGDPEGRATATVALTIRNTVNEPPDVRATALPPTAAAGDEVTLDASATTDPNGDGLGRFEWQQTAGTTVVLEDASTDASWSRVRFTAPVLTADEVLRFLVRVPDAAKVVATGEVEVAVTVIAGGCESDGDCDDTNPCTEDVCRASGACEHRALTGDCDDGDSCTSGDHCVDGACIAESTTACDDGNPCTADVCTADGGCTHVPGADACEDGDACTSGERCVDGECLGGTAIDCDDGNACTDDTCDTASGCRSTAREGACDDGDPCTSNDHCAAGACVGEGDPVACGCESDADCASFENGDLCDGTYVCEGGACALDPGTVVRCQDTDALDCLVPVCDPATGACSDTPQTDGMPCDDDNACTDGDACARGVCAGASERTCDDNDPCTADACAPATGCTHVANAAPCDDGDPCTLGDLCVEGDCRAGAPAECDDNNPCTDDACDTASGGCQHTAAVTRECDDGDACTAGDACDEDGSCVGGRPIRCADESVCTRDECDPDTGCVFPAVADGSPCELGDACTGADACVSGTCTAGAPILCNDGNPCTDDVCTEPTGCVFPSAEGAGCDDDNPCTSGDRCRESACVGEPDPQLCSCFTDAQCPSDGDQCNGQEFCNLSTLPFRCDRSEPIVCDASEDTTCLANTCMPTSGTCAMRPANEGAACEDGDGCSVRDKCLAGACQPGEALSCDDGDACTTDACESPSGTCTHREISGCCRTNTDCADGNRCTADVCSSSHVCTNPALPLGSRCDTSLSTHGAVCDAVGGCRAVSRDVFPDAYSSSSYEYVMRSVDVKGGEVYAAGRQWYYLMRVTAPPINEERGAILTIDQTSGDFAQQVYASSRAGGYRAMHAGLAVGTAGVARLASGRWTAPTATSMGLTDTVLTSFNGVFGGADASICCSEGWVLPTTGGTSYRCSQDASVGLWSCGATSVSPRLETSGGPVFGFIHRTSGTTLDLAIRHTWQFTDTADLTTPKGNVWYNALPTIDSRWGLVAPGCDGAAGAACGPVTSWKDAHGLRGGSREIVCGVGSQGSVVCWDSARGTWQAVAIPSDVLRGVTQRDITWTGVYIHAPSHLFLVGYVDECLPDRTCPLVDEYRALVLLYGDAERGTFREMTRLDVKTCGNGLGTADCRAFTATKLEVHDITGVEANGVLTLYMVGSYPSFDAENARDLRASVYHLPLTLDRVLE